MTNIPQPGAPQPDACRSAASYARSDFCVIAAVNSDFVLEQCLAASPDVVSGDLPITIIRGANCMAEAYNTGLAETDAAICLFVHQDVYLPRGWLDRAVAAINRLEQHHPDWLVAGPYGVRKDGSHIGRVWDVNMARELGQAGFDPQAIESLDELLLVVKRVAGFKFDPSLPSFHLYGTDIVQSAWDSGMSAWAIELPVVHNNRPWATLGGGYVDAYRYVRRKWAGRLPLFSTVCEITHNPLPLWRVRWRRRNTPERKEALLANAVEVAARAGYQ